MLARNVVAPYEGRVEFKVEDLGESPMAEKFGVRGYPAIFIDDVLVATPRDFYDWGTGQRGRYTPWQEQASRDAFVADFERMIELRMEGGDLATRSLTGSDEPASEPRRLPSLTTTDLDGNELSVEAGNGRVTVVEFWAEWCPPCQPTLSWLAKLADRHASEVEVIALALQSDEEAVRKMAAAAAGDDSALRVAMSDADTADAFGGVMAVPTLLVFDREGKLVSTHFGAPPDLEQRISDEIAALIAD